ncbi:hypothetical protein LTR04_004888 [Oleoguttula sp. CCFEE 6159]|nr:hypothetical protein LTR04_004888 [Oleoguttula sp. CCFEE 6159]
MNTALTDEFTSINSIYDATTLELVSTEPTICALQLPSQFTISIRLEFPLDYPDAPPSVLGTQNAGDEGTKKGAGKRLADLARDVLARVYRPGEPCIFDLLGEVGEELQRVEEAKHDEQAAGQEDNPDYADGLQEGTVANHDRALASSDDLPHLTPPWTVSPTVTEKRSMFIAHVAPVTSPAQAKSYIAHLLVTDKRVAKATHNISAWRIHGTDDTVYQDCDDDGETAAGGRVLHLMQLMDVWDVVVVVTRWYGGVQLGPDRFRIINGVARDALVTGGFVIKEEGAGKGDGGGGRKKKGKK